MMCMHAANNLTSSVPASMAALTKLIFIDLANNRLTGSLAPALFASWGRMSYLHMV